MNPLLDKSMIISLIEAAQHTEITVQEVINMFDKESKVWQSWCVNVNQQINIHNRI